MSDEQLKTEFKPDPDNWDALQSFFLETPSSEPPVSTSLDNWDVLQSLFDITSDSTPSLAIGEFSGIPPLNKETAQTVLKTLEEAERAKRNAEAASLSAKQAQQIAEAASLGAKQAEQIAETAKTEAQAAHQATEAIKTQAEAAKLTIQQVQQTAETAKTAIQAASSTIETTKTAVKTAEAETETAKVNTQKAYQATEDARSQAEAANRLAQQAQQAAEISRKNAETNQKQIESILKSIGGSPVAPISSINEKPPNEKPLFGFLKKHKLHLLLGSIVLIPLLLLLGKALSSSKPTLSSIHVDPVTGNDASKGTADAPFRTLSHALQQAGTGSNLYLAKGNYRTDRSLTIPANITLVTQPFKDIEGHWAAPFIHALAANKVIAGYPDGSFRPDANLTRAEYATLLTQVFDLSEARSTNNFIDVRPDFWAYSSIQKTYSQNFLKGFPEGDFKPNDKVQRVHVISALVSGLRLSPTNLGNTLSIYQDRSLIPTWAAASVATATTEQLIVNYPNLQNLNPTQSATRAETITMMYQTLVNQGKMSAIDSPYLVKQ
jgi:hypothetical protein